MLPLGGCCCAGCGAYVARAIYPPCFTAARVRLLRPPWGVACCGILPQSNAVRGRSRSRAQPLGYPTAWREARGKAGQRPPAKPARSLRSGLAARRETCYCTPDRIAAVGGAGGGGRRATSGHLAPLPLLRLWTVGTAALARLHTRPTGSATPSSHSGRIRERAKKQKKSEAFLPWEGKSPSDAGSPLNKGFYRGRSIAVAGRLAYSSCPTSAAVYQAPHRRSSAPMRPRSRNARSARGLTANARAHLNRAFS